MRKLRSSLLLLLLYPSPSPSPNMASFLRYRISILAHQTSGFLHMPLAVTATALHYMNQCPRPHFVQGIIIDDRNRRQRRRGLDGDRLHLSNLSIVRNGPVIAAQCLALRFPS